MSGIENVEDIKNSYESKVKSLRKDIDLLKEKIDVAVNNYSQEKIESQNIDIAFKRILNVLIQSSTKTKT